MRTSRLARIGVLFAGLLLLLLGRLAQLQLFEHEAWLEQARRSRSQVRSLPFHRGRILDRDGVVLARDRRSYDLLFEYRAFRRGHPAGQIFEALALLGDTTGGIAECFERAEELLERFQRIQPAELQAMHRDDRGDFLFYLGRLFHFARGEEYLGLLQWANEGTTSFGEAFPERETRYRQGLAKSRERWRRLDRRVVAELKRVPRGGLMSVLEEDRRELEWRIRQRALRVAAGRGFGLTSYQVLQRARLDEGGPTRSEEQERLEFLRALAVRWDLRPDPDSIENLGRILVTEFSLHPGERQARFDDFGVLLRHVQAVRPEDLQGVRRKLVFQIHRDRTTRIARDVSYEVGDLLAQNPGAYPGLRVEENPVRDFPTPIAPHIVGQMRAPAMDDLQPYHELREEYQELVPILNRTPAQEERFQELREELFQRVLRPGDITGGTGAEWKYRELLRGERGFVEVLRSSEDEPPEELLFRPARNGQDLHLALSTRWIEAAESAVYSGYELARREYLDEEGDDWLVLEGLETPRAGLAMIDLRNGSVVVLATVPTYDPVDYRRNYQELNEDTFLSPLRHRALGGGFTGLQVPYPGSTFKLVSAVEALENHPGVEDWTYECTRVFHPTEGQRLQCLGLHGWVDLRDAIRQSCNIYFYKLAEELGYEAIRERALQLGFGAPTGFPLTSRRTPAGGWELSGPSRYLEKGTDILRPRGRGRSPVPAMRLAIGQTYVTTSPLQMARFYGWLGTGKLWRPLLAPGAPGEEPSFVEPPVDAGVRRLLHEALREVVSHPEGSAYHPEYALSQFQVAGKTGTAQIGIGEDGAPIPVHAWFAGYFPADEPRYAVAVLCENAGLHGGDIASLVLYEFLRRVGEELPR